MTDRQKGESEKPLFALGQTVATPGALSTLETAGQARTNS